MCQAKWHSNISQRYDLYFLKTHPSKSFSPAPPLSPPHLPLFYHHFYFMLISGVAIIFHRFFQKYPNHASNHKPFRCPSIPIKFLAHHGQIPYFLHQSIEIYIIILL